MTKKYAMKAYFLIIGSANYLTHTKQTIKKNV